MRYYTKEWYRLMMELGAADFFEPVEDKEYSEEELKELYEKMLRKSVEEDRELYNEPPEFDLKEWEENFPEEDFDPDDYMIADIDINGEEINFRNPQTYAELRQYQIDEYAREVKEFKSRPPFDEEEAAAEFEENYRDSLEEPDEDIPAWVRESVDPRLIAMGVLPESVLEKLRSEEEDKERRHDELEELADRDYESFYEDLLEGDDDAIAMLPDWLDPDSLISLVDDLNELDGDYVIDMDGAGGDIQISLLGWDEEGDEVIRTVLFTDAKAVEHEELVIETERDEDGDVTSDCELVAHELYFLEDGYEIHMLFENKGLKYVTLTCEDITCMQQSVE